MAEKAKNAPKTEPKKGNNGHNGHGAVVFDFYDTLVDGSKLDKFLMNYANRGNGENFYTIGGAAAITAAKHRKGPVHKQMKDLFYGDPKVVYDAAKKEKMGFHVFSNGYGPFIKEALATQGINKAGFIDPGKVGSKKQPKSYGNLAKELGVKENDIAFLTDSKAEVRAASDAGINAFLYSPGDSYQQMMDYIKKHRPHNYHA